MHTLSNKARITHKSLGADTVTNMFARWLRCWESVGTNDNLNLQSLSFGDGTCFCVYINPECRGSWMLNGRPEGPSILCAGVNMEWPFFKAYRNPWENFQMANRRLIGLLVSPNLTEMLLHTHLKQKRSKLNISDSSLTVLTTLSMHVIQKTFGITLNRKQTSEDTKTTQISGTLWHLEAKIEGFHNILWQNINNHTKGQHQRMRITAVQHWIQPLYIK